VRELHLFAGCGGGILAGMLLGHRCVGAVELDAYCRRVLRARQADGIIPDFPILEDVREFDGCEWRGRVDVVCGGFPCQPWSTAGKRLGAADERHLWPEMARIIGECRPAFVFAENVSLAAFREPWRDLRGLGYRVPPALCLGARELGAPYLRKRWWLLAADADVDLQQSGQPQPESWRGGAPRAGEVAADADLQRLQGCALPPGPRAEGQGTAGAAGHADGSRPSQRQGERGDACAQLAPLVGATWRAAAPRLLRLVSRAARGMESRRQRIHALGNTQVPIVAATAFTTLMQRFAEIH